MKRLILTLVSAASMMGVNAQNKMLTMEEAILGYHLQPENKNYQWQANTNYYTFVDGDKIVAVDAQSGKQKVVITLEQLNEALDDQLKGFPQYAWVDENHISLSNKRHYVEINLDDMTISKRILMPKGAKNISFNGNDIFAYTKDNNLYVTSAKTGETAITNDKDANIINGQVVSRNEFGIDRGIFWAPEGNKLAFYRKNESAVSTFPLLDITTRTGTVNNIKYPMAGMSSEVVDLGVYDIDTKETVFLEVDDFDKERYLTNITWSPDNQSIYIQVLNRAQNEMNLNRYDAKTGKKIETLFSEKSDTYVEPQNPLIFLGDDGSQFIYRTNNRDGYHNLYLHAVDGKLIKNLTPVKADVAYIANDGKNIYYTSAEVSPVENHLFSTSIKSGKKTRLTKEEGWHQVTMSPDKRFFIDMYSSLNVPRVIGVKSRTGKNVRTLLNAKNPMEDYNLGEITMGTVKGTDGVTEHHYRMIKPANFDPNKKYPLIVYVYGGPHSQLVKNNWQGSLRMWEMFMAQQGYAVFVMDNRGTANRGKAYETAIHGQCGQMEMEDQIQGVNFMLSQPWIDKDRVGVHGWSYGGFMTISLKTNYPEIFKVAVAGGPVIDWKWYEVMYGERYMGSPLTNQAGYEKTSLIHKAKDLEGKLLICQGAIDDVVLWQHSLGFIRECIKNNIQVDYFPYPCAKHNVIGKDRIHLMQKVTDYFDDYLK